MSHVRFIGDLHFGHTGVEKFRTQFPSEEVMRKYIVDQWNSTVRKRDVVFVMGDAAFNYDGLRSIGDLTGRKILVRGNHDTLPTEAYLEYFEEVHGLYMYKGHWLSHCPIHPTELYGRSNIHGHCHRGGPTEVHQALPNFRNPIGGKATYFNTCAEHLPIPYTPATFGEIRELITQRIANDAVESTIMGGDTN